MEIELYGQTITYGHSVEVYNKIRSDYRLIYEQKVENCREEFLKAFSKMTFEQAFGMIEAWHDEIRAFCVDKAIEILYTKGDHFADDEEFCETYSNQFSIFEYVIQPFVDECNDLQETYDMAKEALKIEKMGRSHWEGGGFGMKGAIKGAVQAGILNAGTDMIRGVGDARKERKIRGGYEDKRQAILSSQRSLNTIFMAFYKEIQVFPECILDALIRKGLLEPLDLDPASAKTFWKNTMRFKNPDDKELKNVIVTCLSFDPFCSTVYESVFKADKEDEELIAFAAFFDMLPTDIINQKISMCFELPESTDGEIILKIGKLEKVNEMYPVTSVNECTNGLLKHLQEECFNEADIERTKRVADGLRKILGDSKAYSQHFGSFEVIETCLQFINTKSHSNRQILSVMDELLEIAGKYELDPCWPTTAVCRLMMSIDPNPGSEDITAEEVIKQLKEKYLKVIKINEKVLSNNILTYTILLYGSISSQNVNENSTMTEFKDGNEYQEFLDNVKKLIFVAAAVTKLVSDPEQKKDLIKSVKTLILKLKKDSVYKVSYRNSHGYEDVRRIAMPDSIKVYLQHAEEYIDGKRKSLSYDEARIIAKKAQEETARKARESETQKIQVNSVCKSGGDASKTISSEDCAYHKEENETKPQANEMKKSMPSQHERPNPKPNAPRPKAAVIASELCESIRFESGRYFVTGKSLSGNPKCAKAKQYFNIPGDEDVYLIFDDSLLGTCGSGFALATGGLYMKDSFKDPKKYTWREFADVTIKNGFFSGFTVDGISFTNMESKEKICFKVLTELQERLKGII